MPNEKIPAQAIVVPGQGNKPLSRPAHALPYASVLDELSAREQDGLDAADAKQRLETYGRNDLGEGQGVQPIKILISQVANAMTLVILSTLIEKTVIKLIQPFLGAHHGHGRVVRHRFLH
jgi:magnesium-transporting ATPase (P-type)